VVYPTFDLKWLSSHWCKGLHPATEDQVAARNTFLIPRSHSNKNHISHNKMIYIYIYIYIYASVRIRYLLPLTMEIPSIVGCVPREDYIQGEATESLRVTILFPRVVTVRNICYFPPKSNALYKCILRFMGKNEQFSM